MARGRGTVVVLKSRGAGKSFEAKNQSRIRIGHGRSERPPDRPHARPIFPDLPLYVVSEFPPSPAPALRHVGALPGQSCGQSRAVPQCVSRQIHPAHAGVLLVPNVPFRRMRVLALLLAPLYFLAVNENLNDFMLRSGRAFKPSRRHFAWRTRNFVRWHLSKMVSSSGAAENDVAYRHSRHGWVGIARRSLACPPSRSRVRTCQRLFPRARCAIRSRDNFRVWQQANRPSASRGPPLSKTHPRRPAIPQVSGWLDFQSAAFSALYWSDAIHRCMHGTKQRICSGNWRLLRLAEAAARLVCPIFRKSFQSCRSD